MSDSKPFSRKTLRRQQRQSMKSEDLHKFIDDVRSDGSDRAIAVVAVANLDAGLSELLAISLPRNDDDTMDRLHANDGPLARLYAKIELAYALELISDEQRTQLHIFRSIRNDFAHTAAHMTFESDRVKKDFDKITTREMVERHFKGRENLNAKEYFAANALALETELTRAKAAVATKLAAEIRQKLQLLEERKKGGTQPKK
jgi:DNA-binding MltR family transcriptional regulator